MPKSTPTRSEVNAEAKSKLDSHTIAGIVIGVFVAALGYNMCSDPDTLLFGIIFIIVGIMSPFLGYSMGQSLISGNCPYCGHKLTSYKTKQSTTCSICKQRVIFRDNRYWTIN